MERVLNYRKIIETMKEQAWFEHKKMLKNISKDKSSREKVMRDADECMKTLGIPENYWNSVEEKYQWKIFDEFVKNKMEEIENNQELLKNEKERVWKIFQQNLEKTDKEKFNFLQLSSKLMEKLEKDISN